MADVGVFISAYGVETAPGVVPKVQAELRIVYRTTQAEGGGGDPAVQGEVAEDKEVVFKTGAGWQGYDANDAYSPSKENSGCAWYFYPEENMDAAAFPAGTPLAPTASSALSRTSAGWSDVIIRPQFDVPLAAKSSAPVSVSTYPTDAAVTSFPGTPGHFFFDLGKNVQGGVTLTVTLPAAIAHGDAIGQSEQIPPTNAYYIGGVGGGLNVHRVRGHSVVWRGAARGQQCCKMQ